MTADYPSRSDLRRVKKWPREDIEGLFTFLKSIWWPDGDWGWTWRGRKIRVSTGGWSGNEELIIALQKNHLIWALTWEETRVGGHYKFEIPKAAK